METGKMTTIYVDGKPVEVDPTNSLLNALLTAGFDIPYFCWHPALGSVGACRQCAVKKFKDENDTRGQIVMSCLEPVQAGMRISIADPEAREFRAHVLEWLMTSHPHDCPVCDEGGECHLQDMTVMTGHVYRRYHFKKRTHRNQYLGPFVQHEMNRCIQCYRCVRFYADTAGGKDLNVFAAHDSVYFGRHEDGVLESEFSGNLVEICPTGVFTDKTFRSHFVRKWDLTTAPSVCVHCGLGCNTIPGERDGQLRRIRNRYNGSVNGYFLCDRGRYGYEFVNSSRRLRKAALTGADGRLFVETGKAVESVAALLSQRENIVGIGSPRASLEANFALRQVVGRDHFYAGLSSAESRGLETALRILRTGPARTPSLQEAARAQAVLILGEDPSNTAPLLALALRQAVRELPLREVLQRKIPAWQDSAAREVIQDARGPLFIATVEATRLDEISQARFRGAPEDIARLGYAVAHAIDRGAPAVKEEAKQALSLAGTIAAALRSVERPLVVTGTSSGSSDILKAAANVAWSLCGDNRCAGLFVCVPECNSLGLAMSGAKPLEEAFEAARQGKVKTAIILENDLWLRAAGKTVEEFLDLCETVVVLDHLETGTTEKADIVIPVSTFAESDGTLINNEGRAQRYYKAIIPRGEVRESWRWLRDIGRAAGLGEVRAWETLDDCIRALVEAQPHLAGVERAAPPADFRLSGQKIARQPRRLSGRTAGPSDGEMPVPKPPADPDSPLAFSMEGYEGRPPSSLIPFYWSPGWNSVQALNKYQSAVGESLRGGDPGIRLIEPMKDARPQYFGGIPSAFTPRESEWLVVPLHRVFGSEELSRHSPPVMELASGVYVSLHPFDAERLGASEGDELELSLDDSVFILSARISEGMPKGVAGVPLVVPDIPGPVLPAWGRIRKRGR
jgi:NADH-quinone oxidoreductase subunit G